MTDNFNTKLYILKWSLILILCYSCSKYSLNDTLNFLLPKLPGWIEPDADVGRDMFELIESRGFKYESHLVETKDGFLLQLVRLINPYNVNKKSKYRPVILAHGVECTASVYLINNRGYLNSDGIYYEWDENNELINGSNQMTNTLAFTLSSRGFDVWLANFRGTIYSKNKHFNDTNDEYWNFSMDESIEFDLPAIIDYVLMVTNHTKLSYIGHSQANIFMIALMTESYHYQQIVQPFISLSPTWYNKDVITVLSVFPNFAQFMQNSYGPAPFYNMKYLRTVLSTLCSHQIIRWICYNIFHHFVGFYPSDMRVDRFPVYVDNVPSGSSIMTIDHHSQTYINGLVSHYDYGLEKNLQCYNQSKPPIYNISNINSEHIVFFQSTNDRISPLTGNEKLKKQLPVKLLRDFIIDKDDFQHMSFIWSKYSGELINRKILNVLQMYDNDNYNNNN